MELANRYYGEKSGFVTTRSQPITMKSPEYASQAQMEYISDLYQRFEDAVFAGNGRNALGEHYTDIADLESLAKYYMISEWCSNMDSGLTSTYFYKPEGADSKLFAGPVWDYDIAFGNNKGTRYGCDYNNPEEFTVCFGRQYRNTVFGKLDVDYKHCLQPPLQKTRICRGVQEALGCGHRRQARRDCRGVYFQYITHHKGFRGGGRYPLEYLRHLRCGKGCGEL